MLVKLTITAQAYNAIVDSLPPKSKLKKPSHGPNGAHYIWLEATDAKMLDGMRRPGEDVSDCIIRLAGTEI